MSALLLFGQTAPLLGNPTGGQVASGSAAINSAGKTLTINQTSHTAIINWQSFSIGAGELTKFVQPNSTSAALNRVISGNPSAIYGTLSSNGQIYLINPNGILVGPGGVVNTAGFTASTRDISDQDFLSGNLHFTGNSDGGVENLGTIDAFGGNVYLIGNTVDNQGTINAPQGTAGLGAGNDVLITQGGTESLFVEPNANSSSTPSKLTGVHNSGKIAATSAELKAANGNMYALAINNSGTVVATTVKHQGGHIYLTSDSGTIINSGTLDASATTAGGQGGSITLKSAHGTTVNTASGRILATGGSGGQGGTIETSGDSLQINGTVSAGKGGRWLLDPSDVTIDNGSGVAPDVNVGTLETALNGGTSETVQAVGGSTDSGNIDLNAALTWTSSATLQLTATGNINLSQPLSGTAGTLSLSAGGAIADTASLSVSSFILQSGSWTQNTASLPAFTASSDFELQNSSTFLRVTGGNGTSAPYQITDIYGLQGLASPSNSLLAVNAELMNNIDATSTTAWNLDAGFVPIGSALGYTGIFDGQTHTINGLFIYTPSATNVGLFGMVGTGGTVKNVSVTNVQVSGSAGVGALVGASESGSIVTNDSSTGIVAGDGDVGGLVGYNDGAISNAYSTATVTGDSASNGVGGLAGYNYTDGTISTSYSTGAVSGNANVGGLVGANGGMISNAFSTGGVTGSDGTGGLVGDNFAGSSISNAYSTGAITSTGGNLYAGGLVGFNAGTISNSFWDTDTAGITIISGVGSDVTPNSTAGVTQATTAQLESPSFSAPTWDFTNVWTIVSSHTPQLIGLPVTASPSLTGMDSLSGIAYTNSGVTDSPGVVIDLIFNGGSPIFTTTNGSGDFSFSVSSSDLTGGILLTDATDKGNTFYQANSPALTITGIDIWGSTLRVVADTASNTALQQTAGSVSGSGINYTVTGSNLSTASGVNMNILSGYTLDGNITASGSFTAGSGAVITASQAAILTGTSVTLGGSINTSGALTVVSTTGDIDATDATIVAPSATFTSAGAVNMLSEQLIALGGNVTAPSGSGYIDITNATTLTAHSATLTSTGPLFIVGSTITLSGGTLMASGNGLANTSDSDQTDGVDIFNSTLNAQGGAISLTGNAGYSDAGSVMAGFGILIGNDGIHTTTIETSGSGDITLMGTFAQNITSLSGNGMDGVNMYGTGNTISVAGGLISITGTVSQGVSGNSTNPGSITAVEIGGGALVEATASGGSISITGNASGSTAFDSGANGGGANGIEIGGNSGPSTVVSVTTNGSILLHGTGGAVDSSYADSQADASQSVGVQLDNGMHLTAGASSAISITGQGGSAVSSGLYAGSAGGVHIGGDGDGGTVMISAATGGSISIAGTGGTINTTNTAATTTSNNLPGVEGVSMDTNSSIIAAGTATITITGHGGTVTAGTNKVGEAFGVGIGTDSDSNPGTTLLSSGSGAIQITGVGGTTPNLGIGVVLFGFNNELCTISSTSGPITITGTGGSGYTGSGAVSGFSVPSYGVGMVDDVLLETEGAGALTIIGTGGSNSADVDVQELPAGSFDPAPALPTLTATGALFVTSLSSAGINLQAMVGAASATLASIGSIDIAGSASSLDVTGALNVNAGGAILDSAPVSAGSFILQGGAWTQIVGQNGLTALPAFTASTNFELLNSSTFERFAGGNGSIGNPYQIADVYGLQGLGSPSQSLLAVNAELVNNIDATSTASWNTGAGFVPIGVESLTTTSDYAGTFDGQGFVINGLTIDRPTQSFVGLFGGLGSLATLKNIGLTNVNLSGSIDVGGLAGDNLGVILQAYSTGAIRGTTDVGGLVGLNSGGTVNESYSSVAVTGATASSDLGGLVGFNGNGSGGLISNAYSTGAVAGGSTSANVGGLVGENDTGATITNTYSTGLVSGNNGVGGLVGHTLGTISNSFWDSDTAGVAYGDGYNPANNTPGVTAATTAQLQAQSFILDNSPTSPTWDFTPGTGVWGSNGVTGTLVGGVLTAVSVNGGLPYFQWQFATPIELAAHNQTITYGGSLAPDSLEYSVLPSTATLSSYITGGISFTVPSTNVNVGVYPGTIGFIVKPNLGVTIEQSLGDETITPGTLTLVTETGVTANNKVYNGTTAATLNLSSYSLSGVLAGDTITIDPVGYTANFATKNVGTGIAVTVSNLSLSGTDPGNYTLAEPVGLTANITPATLTVTGISANNKVYDGTTAATLNLSGADLHGIVGDDSVTVDPTGYIANFSDANVNTAIPVTVTNLGLSGVAAGDYTLTQPTGLRANITSAQNNNPPPPPPSPTINTNPTIVNQTAPANLNVPEPTLPSFGNNDNDLLPVSYSGNGSFGQTGPQGGPLASSSGNGGDIGSGDAGQLYNGGLNNVSNPAAGGALNQALGPEVRMSLFDALQADDESVFADTNGTPPTPDNGAHETILSEGDVVQIEDHKIKRIPLSQVPKQLQDALGSGVLKGLPSGAGTGH